MAQSLKRMKFDEKVFSYIEQHGYRFNDIKEALLKETVERWPEVKTMSTQRQQADMMEMLVQAMNAKKCLEVGVFTGMSSLCIAMGLPDDGKLLALDVSEEWASVGRKYWQMAGVDSKIDLVIAPATETLDKLIAEGQENTFDFAFIDADKPNYIKYYDAIIPLLRPGGVCLIDNVLWEGKVADETDNEPNTEVMRQVNDHVNNDPRVKGVILPFSDGVYFVTKQ